MSVRNIEDDNNYPLFLSKYSYLEYKPGNSANWNVVPDDVYTALDELAAGVSVVPTITTDTPIIGDGIVGTPITFASDTANKVLATPNGSSGVSSMRAIVVNDVPILNQNTTGTASNITATTNTTLVTLSSLSLPVSQLSDIVPISRGGTGASFKDDAYNNLNPMNTRGDITYESANGVASRLPIGSSGQVLTVSGGVPTWEVGSTPGLPTVSQKYFTQVYLDTFQTIPNNVSTALTYNSVHNNNSGQPIFYNTSTCWNLTTGTFTAPASGVYKFNAYVEWAQILFNPFSGPANILLRNNTRGYDFGCGQIDNLSPQTFEVGCSGTTYLSAGNTVSVWVYQNAGNDVAAQKVVVSSFLVTSN